MFKKQMKIWLAALALSLFGITAQAEQTPLRAGPDYVVIDPAQPTDNPAKIEVIEFFSYGCSHCNALSPFINKWSAKMPSDVSFKRIPVGFGNPYYQNLAKMYYALEALGELTRLDDAVFNAIHGKGLKLIDEKSILEWATSQGIDAKKFSDAYKSFGVDSKAKRADQLTQAFKIKGVPALAVNGHYQVTGNDIKSHEELLTLTDRVIEKVRTERTSKKK